MSTGLHKDLELVEIHRPYAWEYANAAARTGASGFDASDVGKLARQTDDASLWQLTATTPTWKAVDGASGEANTASNVGTAGVGVFKQKTGVDLEFKKVNAGSAKVTVVDDTGNDEVDVDVVTGTDGNSVCIGNDARLSDARTPTAHATTHQSGGGDSIKIDDLAAPDDNTDLDATTSAHGLLPKLGGGTTNFLRADGSWEAPPAGGQTLYDAIVAPSGGDYTSVYAAFNAGHKTVYLRSGTYIETNTIVIPNGGKLDGENDSIINFNGGAYRVQCDGSGGTQETAGTISVATGSTAVTGVGTTFTNLSPGDQIKIGSSWFEIDTITDNTNLDLVYAWRGEAVSGAAMLGQTMYRAVRLRNIRIINSSVQGLYVRAVLGLKLANVDVFACSGNNIEVHDSYGINFEQSISKNSGGDGFYFEDCEELTCGGYCHGDNNEDHGLHIAGACDDIKVSQSSFTSNTLGGVFVNGTVRNCTLTALVVSYNDGKGIETGPTTKTCAVVGCVAEYNGGVGIDWDGEDNSITACVVANNGAGGVLSGNDGTVNGNHIEDNTGIGVALSSGDSKNNISNNHITGNTGDGVNCAGDNNLFTNNSIADNGGNGVDLTSLSSGNRFVNNRITGNTSTNYVDAGTDNIRIEDRIEAAIHDDVAAEISAITEKTTPVSADLLLIEDSAAANAKKRVQVGNLPAAAPSAHATTHQSGGSDSIKLDNLAAPDDNTDLDASTSAHGLLKKLGGGTTNFLRADGAWAAPVASAVFGSEYDYEEKTTQQSTSSTSFQQYMRLATASLPAGTYRIGWMAVWTGSDSTDHVKIRLQVDDTTNLISPGVSPNYLMEEPNDSSGDRNQVSSGFRHVTLGAGVHNIDMDFASEESADTAYIRHGQIEIWRVS